MTDGLNREGFTEDRHVFEIAVRSRFARGTWWGRPFTLEVQAYNLIEAMRIASRKSFSEWSPPDRDDDDDVVELLEHIKTTALIPGEVELSSGQKADHYVDLRRITLGALTAPLVGRVMLERTADLDYDAVGGLSLGADPVALAIMNAAAAEGRQIDTFVVRKDERTHGLQRRIEGPDVAGRRVLVVEDVCTTGASALVAEGALREAGAEVVGVAMLMDRGGGAAMLRMTGLDVRNVYTLDDLDV